MTLAIINSTQSLWHTDSKKPGAIARYLQSSIHYPAVWISLTYAHTLDPITQLERARQDQHIIRFVRALSLRCGREITHWFRKLEFQDDGTIHYHILIDNFDYIDKFQVADAWPHGTVDIKPVRRKTIRYLAKYCAKTHAVNEFLQTINTRNLRITGSSQHFGPQRKQRAYPPSDIISPNAWIPLCDRIFTTTTISDGTNFLTIKIRYSDLISSLVSSGILLTILPGRAILSADNEVALIIKAVENTLATSYRVKAGCAPP